MPAPTEQGPSLGMATEYCRIVVLLSAQGTWFLHHAENFRSGLKWYQTNILYLIILFSNGTLSFAERAQQIPAMLLVGGTTSMLPFCYSDRVHTIFNIKIVVWLVRMILDFSKTWNMLSNSKRREVDILQDWLVWMYEKGLIETVNFWCKFCRNYSWNHGSKFWHFHILKFPTNKEKIIVLYISIPSSSRHAYLYFMVA